MNNTDLVNYLRQVAELRGNKGFEQFILDYGRDYVGTKRPRGFRKQKDRECFKNATHLALGYPFHYVEGFAIHQDLFPMHHAWVVDNEGHVIDTTWRYPEESVYRGVEISEEDLFRQMNQHRVYGVFCPSLVGKYDMEFIEEKRKSYDRLAS